MDYVLIIIIAVCVIALIQIHKKRKEEPVIDPIVVKGPDTSDANDKTEPSSDVAKKEEKPSGPPQYTIYQLSAKKAMRVCPFCDGENRTEALVCNICGRDLYNRKG